MAVKATGTITTVAGADLLDGQTFTISDGHQSVVFEFDDDVSVLAGHISVPFDSMLDSADDVRDAVITAINAVATFFVTAASGGAAQVDLTNDFFGTIGNVAVAETVANVGFMVAGLAGGVDAVVPARVYRWPR